MSVGEIARLAGGKLLCGDARTIADGISTDSRSLRAGHVFLALKGDRFDGHDFLKEALQKSAAGVIGEADKLSDMTRAADSRAALITVGDTLSALHTLARNYRSKFDIPIVAVTGSCGKTTTKDMLASILSQFRTTLKTEGNLNNFIGTPLMLLRMDSTTQAAVLEIASNAPGEIRKLAEVVQPTAGIITNIAAAHLEGLGSLEGVLEEKCSLLPFISPSGFLVTNREEVPLERARSMFSGKIITVGAREPADFYATDVRQDLRAGVVFRLNGKEMIRLPIAGMHNVMNALAAIAAAVQLGVDPETLQKGLDAFSPASMRMQICACRGATIINDAYNANPRAMRESISTVLSMQAERRILVLGDMLELGKYSRDEHRLLGRYVADTKTDLLYLRGEFAGQVEEGALEGGMQAERIYRCETPDEIAASLKYILRPGDLVLVKGSRGMQMEKVVQHLSEET